MVKCTDMLTPLGTLPVRRPQGILARRAGTPPTEEVPP